MGRSIINISLNFCAKKSFYTVSDSFIVLGPVTAPFRKHNGLTQLIKHKQYCIHCEQSRHKRKKKGFNFKYKTAMYLLLVKTTVQTRLLSIVCVHFAFESKTGFSTFKKTANQSVKRTMDVWFACGCLFYAMQLQRVV